MSGTGDDVPSAGPVDLATLSARLPAVFLVDAKILGALLGSQPDAYQTAPGRYNLCNEQSH